MKLMMLQTVDMSSFVKVGSQECEIYFKLSGVLITNFHPTGPLNPEKQTPKGNERHRYCAPTCWLMRIPLGMSGLMTRI